MVSLPSPLPPMLMMSPPRAPRITSLPLPPLSTWAPAVVRLRFSRVWPFQIQLRAATPNSAAPTACRLR